MGQVDTADRQRFWRASFRSDAVVEIGDNVINGHLLDISIRGALVEMPSEKEVPAQTPCTIKLELTNDARIEMQGKVMHQRERNIGVRCEQIDIDSMTHLRRLIELNAGDDDQLQRDLNSLVII